MPGTAIKLSVPHRWDGQLEKMPRGCPWRDGHCWNWLMHNRVKT